MNDVGKISNPSGLYFGKYRGVVVDNKHPKRFHMAKVRVFGIQDGLTVETLPWAEYNLPLGARPQEGTMMPCQIGDLVWVEFIGGDTRTPLIAGACYRVDGDGSGESLLPCDGFSDTYQHQRTAKQPPPPSAEYGDRVLDQMYFLQQLTQSGEFCITHKPTGTAIHVNEHGQLVIHTQSDRFDSVSGDLTTEVTKSLSIIVKGNVTEEITGDVERKVNGNVTETIGGNYTQEVTGTTQRKAELIKDIAKQIHHN